MATSRSTVKLTATFEANLAAVESFLMHGEPSGAFDRLLGELADHVIPNLERFPAMGRRFPDGPPGSVEARHAWERLRARFGTPEIREYVAGDFVILYALRDRVVFLLAVKHHRQLTYALADPRQ